MTGFSFFREGGDGDDFFFMVKEKGKKPLDAGFCFSREE